MTILPGEQGQGQGRFR